MATRTIVSKLEMLMQTSTLYRKPCDCCVANSCRTLKNIENGYDAIQFDHQYVVYKRTCNTLKMVVHTKTKKRDTFEKNLGTQ